MSARDDLLQTIVDEVAAHGLADRSLRELADAVGSSHRMLLYHFGSRDGLVAAVVAHVEAGQRLALAADVGSSAPTDAVSVMRASWARTSDPAMRPLVQLFFEAVAYAGRTGSADFTGPWIADALAAAQRLGVPFDEADARLGVAVIRGLMIDVLATDDLAAATAAFERFVELVGARPG